MKKVKLMIMSLTVLAVVGGALAFKAKGSLDYCTAPTNPDGSCPAQCPTRISDGKIDPTVDFVCTTLTSGLADPCKNSAGQFLSCTTTTVQITHNN